MVIIAKNTLLSIANKASFISERINHSLHSKNNLATELEQDSVTRQINNWCKLVGGKDNLEKFLHRYGLDLDSVRPFMATGHLTESSLPSWMKTFKALVKNSKNILVEPPIKKDLPIDSEQPLPFEDFYLGFIVVARNQLNNKLTSDSISRLFSNEAYKALERNLLKQLVNLGTETLLVEFKQYSSQEQADIQTENNKYIYTSFIENLHQDGGIDFFSNYPVLARLISTTIDLWIKSTTELIQRLQNDFPDIESNFSDRKNIGKVSSIETSLAHLHQGNRLDLDLTFTSGVKIVYKPKDVSLRVGFNQLLNCCNVQNISLPFKLTKILERQGYGWIEYITHQPCLEEAEVKNFYKRAGMLLSLLYVLRAKNCYAENVIAHGQYPILIDADILMQPSPENSDELDKWFKHSVAGVGFLPAWNGDIYAKSSQDFSALGNIHPHQINSAREWQFINTDKMHLARKSKVIPAGTNVVMLKGKTVAPYNYQEDIITGFEEIYNLLIEHRETLINTDGFLSKFKSSKSRFIIHPTLTYAVATKKSLSPQYLTNGFDYSLVIDILNLNHSTTNNPEVITAEATSIQQQDIPYFSVACDSNSLEIDSDKSIPNFFKTSSYQQLISRLQYLSQKDLALQLKIIHLSLYSKTLHRNTRNTVASPQDDFTNYEPITSEQLVQEAIKIGDSLVNSVIRQNNDYNWLSLKYMLWANRYQLKPLDDSLYAGRVGVCLFLAALAKVTGDSKYQDVTLSALSSLQDSLDKPEARQRLIKPGLGVMGIGGILYSLVKTSNFLEKPELLKTAQEIAKLITPEVIARDHQLDIMFGLAGAIPGLLSLYQETKDNGVLDTAIICGNHLLSKRTDTYPRAWKTLAEARSNPMTGFSHGASGIALSLLRLYAVTSNITYLEAAKEGIEYESSVFDKSLKRWPDFSFLEQTNQLDVMYAWCNGTPGIGLARLDSLSMIKSKEIYDDIETALDMTQKYELSNASNDIDHLCCGSLGRTELFVLASQTLHNQEWLKFAKQNTALVIAKAKENNQYSLFPNSCVLDSVLSPGFFQGIAGLGYQFLRLANPQSLPSILMFK